MHRNFALTDMFAVECTQLHCCARYHRKACNATSKTSVEVQRGDHSGSFSIQEARGLPCPSPILKCISDPVILSVLNRTLTYQTDVFFSVDNPYLSPTKAKDGVVYPIFRLAFGFTGGRFMPSSRLQNSNACRLQIVTMERSRLSTKATYMQHASKSSR
jgi:hypothetical protein